MSYKGYIESNNMEYIVCPVCGKKDKKTKISRHIMNSRKEKNHGKFIKRQEELVVKLILSYIEPCKIAQRDDIFCSPTYIRKIIKNNINNYEEYSSIARSVRMKQEYKDGKRKTSSKFAGWRPKNRKEAGKRAISEERYDRIIELFHSNKTQNEVAKIVNAKSETVHNYWVQSFGEEETKLRIEKNKFNIYKINDETVVKLKELFYSDKTRSKIAEECGLKQSKVYNFFRNNFSDEEREERRLRIQKISIRKSLESCGKCGTSGSRPENLCYELLKSKTDYKIIHHDMDVCEPYEIDITIPSLKIAICWDGPFHRLPIFGKKQLEKTIKRDKKKINKLLEDKWSIIIVKDNSDFNPKIVENTVSCILENISSKFKMVEIFN